MPMRAPSWQSPAPSTPLAAGERNASGFRESRTKAIVWMAVEVQAWPDLEGERSTLEARRNPMRQH